MDTLASAPLSGLLPPAEAESIVAAGKQAFVDGLSLAAAVGAVVVLVTAALVKRYLPSDRGNPEVTGEPELELALD